MNRTPIGRVQTGCSPIELRPLGSSVRIRTASARDLEARRQPSPHCHGDPYRSRTGSLGRQPSRATRRVYGPWSPRPESNRHGRALGERRTSIVLLGDGVADGDRTRLRHGHSVPSSPENYDHHTVGELGIAPRCDASKAPPRTTVTPRSGRPESNRLSRVPRTRAPPLRYDLVEVPGIEPGRHASGAQPRPTHSPRCADEVPPLVLRFFRPALSLDQLSARSAPRGNRTRIARSKGSHPATGREVHG